MPTSEKEATLQATANLSPVSPSPVHSAKVLVVPALQHTVDTIDAMVAAAAATSNGIVDAPHGNGEDAVAPGSDAMEDIVDDDSFDDAYGEEAGDGAAAQAEEEMVDNDDYAKTFDSPIDSPLDSPPDSPIDSPSGPEEGEDQEDQHHVSSEQRESSDTSSLSSDRLTSHPSEVSFVAPTSSSPLSAAVTATADSLLSQLEADARPDFPPTTVVADPPAAVAAAAAASPTPLQAMTAMDSASLECQQSAVDIQQLMADLTARPTESSHGDPDPSSPSATSMTAEAPANTSSLPSTALPSSSSLPPRPPLPQTTVQSYASQHLSNGSNPSIPADAAVSLASGSASSLAVTAGVSGTSAEAAGGLTTLSAAGLNAQAPISAMNVPPYPPNAPESCDGAQDPDYQRQWTQFVTDERQYMSEAKWDRFPTGSRIFIGNLSSDKVSKRDVFDIFHKFGRLAQISLKSAYGFVQYHTVDEGRRALENLQDIEVKGRKIHLEISRAQEKQPKKERSHRSPERSRGGRRAARQADTYTRDENRSQRNHSPRRGDYYSRADTYTGDRGAYHDSAPGGRGRSRSPRYRRDDRDYRRRSPSPYGGRSRHDSELEMPRRYGSDVPDVQIIMQPDVSRDFATWIEGAFKARGLKTAVMFLHPRFPKEQIIQRQAAEGVLAIVDLELRSQNLGRIPIQLFDRSGGMHNVRFEQYVDLEPNTAAEIILRAKAPAVANYSQPYGGNGVGYAVPQFGAQAAAYPAMQQQPGGGFAAQPAPAPAAAADIASLMGRVDNVTLQQLLSTLQAAPQGMMAGGHAGYQPAGAKAAPPSNAGGQIDIQAILGSLNGSNGTQHQPPHAQAQYGGQYRGQPQNGGATGATGTGDAAAQVQNIMAQLARYRQ